MRNPFQHFLGKSLRTPIKSSLCALALCGYIPEGMSQANLSFAQNQAILAELSEQKFDRFAAFAKAVQADNDIELSADVNQAIAQYLSDKKALSISERHIIQRLVGLYSRIQYGEEAIEKLGEFVEIPTFRDEAYEQHENPNFIKLGEEIRELAEDFGLGFRNVDNRIWEITLEGTGEEFVGIHAHGDVVPVNPDNWVLDDGTKLDPFKMTLVGDRLYGRGTEDDKNGIIVTMYAMKVLKDEGIPLNRTFKLLVDTTEETSSTAIPYYFERFPQPEYNLALDGGYPVVIAEKGYGTVMATFDAYEGEGKGLEIVDLTGGLATNQIPRVSKATINAKNLKRTKKRLDKIAKSFQKKYEGNYSITTEIKNGHIELIVEGISAHSSSPETGVNPVSRMLLFLHELPEKTKVKKNHVLDAAHYATANWGLNYYGEKLGINYAHDFMGPLTTSLTYIKVTDKDMKLATNLRAPVGKETKQLKQEIQTGVVGWLAENNVEMSLDISIAEPMYRNPEGAWVNALLDVATENLDLPREFKSSAGATSVHYLPNGVQFGLSEPGTKYTGHNANEFKTVYQFMLDLQIITEMMVRVGQLDSLK
ncbi:dipeptidase [Sessilibacter corallicola]|uniref:dipeptidase n=1 Tax=Sessilibacter corallicola TaxID=2904075 RepID=UPI001E4A8E86|nr:dipeptidase [Sessilibacter corallicola]MCE2027753.1 dipeptidase [Sessilibacter corallicola]